MFRTGTLRITPEILSLIAGVDEFKGAWLGDPHLRLSLRRLGRSRGRKQTMSKPFEGQARCSWMGPFSAGRR